MEQNQTERAGASAVEPEGMGIALFQRSRAIENDSPRQTGVSHQLRLGYLYGAGGASLVEPLLGGRGRWQLWKCQIWLELSSAGGGL